MARVYSMGTPWPLTSPISADVVVQQTEVTMRYFLADWPDEDIVPFCQEITSTLENLVACAYAKFP
jgi:hypothetical protein